MREAPLLCLKHHGEIDDLSKLSKYTVQFVLDMKARHLKVVERRISKFISYQADTTRAESPVPASSYAGYAAYAGISGSDLNAEGIALERLRDKISNVPRPARETLGVYVYRATNAHHFLQLQIEQLKQHRLNVGMSQLLIDIQSLDDNRILSLDIDSGYVIAEAESGEYLDILKDYCANTGRQIEQIIVDENWSILD